MKYVTDAVEKAGKEARLPPINRLACDAGVSMVTMWQAVRKLAAAGVLEARPGAGIRIASAREAAGPGATVAKFSRQVLQDIVEGRFHAHEELPAIKELCEIYDTGRDTLRCAIEELVKQNHIVKRGRVFRIRRARFSAKSSLSLLYVYGAEMAEFSETGPNLAEAEQFLNYLEQQCAYRNVRVERAVVDSASSAAFKSSPETVGHIVWRTRSIESFMEPILANAARLGKPTAVYDRTSENLEGFSTPKSKGICILQKDELGAGRTVGNALLRLGHRRICFVAEKLWYQTSQRYKGLVSAFAGAGYPNAVNLVLGDPNAPPPPTSSQDWSSANRNFWFVQNLIELVGNSGIDSGFTGRLQRSLEENAYGQSVYCVLDGPMRSALDDGSATAWIAADGFVGVYAILPFLRSQHVDVPGRLSVVGLSDQYESAYTGLSSYHFDMNGAAMRTLTWMLYPSLDRRFRPGNVETAPRGIDGFILDRGSIGGPRSRP